MTRVHIRTDDEVYRVDAVWLGPPRATFPWRARYSAYGVGLLVMLVVMFLQRRLGIDLGFFSVAWALLITVAVTRFVSRRINDERPLLEWLTLFVHELRGPRAHDRVVGGALTTGHVTVRRDRPRLTGAPTAIALPRGSERGEHVSRPQVGAGTDSWGPPPRDGDPRDAVAEPAAAEPAAAEPAAAEPADPPVEPVPEQRRRATATRSAGHLTPGVEDAVPSHRRGARRAASARAKAVTDERRARTRRPGTAGTAADGGFGPPSSADIGKDEPKAAPKKESAALPPAADTRAADADVAAWTGAGTTRRERVPARRRATSSERAARTPPADADPDRTLRRPTRPRRRPGWPMSNEPAPSAPDAPFGPGTRDGADRSETGRGGGRGDNGAAPR